MSTGTTTPADELAALKRTARTLANIVARNHQVMEAARIEMRQNGPHKAMQWILNSLGDVWDDPETEWDGVESADEWFDRTEAFYREAKANAEASAPDDTGRTLASPDDGARERTGATGGWRGLIEEALAPITGIAEAEYAADAVLDVIRPLAELEDAVNWGTSCLSCARVLDSAYEETVLREAAEAKLAAITAYVGEHKGDAGFSWMHAQDILAIVGSEGQS